MGVPGFSPTGGLNLNSDLKHFAATAFLDKAVVINAVNKGRLKALRKGGAITRTIAMRSIRKPKRLSIGEMSPGQRKRFRQLQARARRLGVAGPERPFQSAKPGEPPRDKTGHLKRTIFFGYDKSTDSVVVGPIAMFSRTAWALEHGGRVMLKGYGGQRVPMTFRGNPFMEPALRKVAPKLPEQFRNIL